METISVTCAALGVSDLCITFGYAKLPQLYIEHITVLFTKLRAKRPVYSKWMWVTDKEVYCHVSSNMLSLRNATIAGKSAVWALCHF